MSGFVYDLILSNGLVFDGKGKEPIKADIAIRDGKIAKIAPQILGPQHTKRDITGLWVTPGFVDIHSHYDIEVEISSGLHESVIHGVTTVVMGNCSLSLTYGEAQELADMFLRVETLPRVLIEKWLHKALSWTTAEEYISHLKTLPLGPNVAPLLGHSSLRAHVMGLERSLQERATARELARMRDLANKAIEAGCIGISIDMVPWHMMSGRHCGKTIPSQHAGFQEYSMLADVCRQHDVVFQATPNPQDYRSVALLLWLGLGVFRRPLRMTVLAALDMVGRSYQWSIFPLVLGLFNGLLRGNARFQTLAEPFTIYSDGPITPLFEEFSTGVALNDQLTAEARRRLWAQESFRSQFRREWTSKWRRTFHRDLQRMRIIESPAPDLKGRTFAEIAVASSVDPVLMFMDLLAQHDTELRWVTTGANARDNIRQKLLSHPGIFPGFSDAGAHVRNLGFYDGAISLLRQAFNTSFMPMERAVARVTSEPAQWFRLPVGTIEVGIQADVVLINPGKIPSELSPQIKNSDPLLDGAMRMVKHVSEEIDSVYIRGIKVVHLGAIQPILGKETLGVVLGPSSNLSQTKAGDIRNSISKEVPHHSFEDYWDIFVAKHRSPPNILFHVVGFILMYGIPLLALILMNPYILLFTPSSQLVGLLGHWLFERSHIDKRDAVLSWRAMFCLHKMFLLFLQGEYSAEVSRVEQELRREVSSG